MTVNALIGATGFVGSNLLRQGDFTHAYSSSNIQEINDRSFDLVVCAGARAEKWRANLDPISDLKNIENLISHLGKITTRQFILISTVDVYPNPRGVEEESLIFADQLAPYGKHRYQLEKFTSGHFPNHTIIRLPGLIGNGLKKNFIFDMLHNPNALTLTHCKSRFQFYSLDTLWEDIQRVLISKLKLVNFATPPLSIEKIARECFGTKFSNLSSQPPVVYDVRTCFARIFNLKGHYIWTPEMEIESIRKFIKSERKAKR